MPIMKRDCSDIGLRCPPRLGLLTFVTTLELAVAELPNLQQLGKDRFGGVDTKFLLPDVLDVNNSQVERIFKLFNLLKTRAGLDAVLASNDHAIATFKFES